MGPRRRRIAAALVVTLAVALGAACGGGAPGSEAGSLDEVPGFAATTEPSRQQPRSTSDLAALVEPAGSADTWPEPSTAAVPVALSFEAIGVSLASVVEVGVDPAGEMEIPAADEVGWYRHGPVPGEPGSAVLAAHISWNGRDGVFRHLTRAEPGQRFTVAFADDRLSEYEVVAVRQYPKDELPDEIFVTTGEPQVVLITCGGSFNRALDSYDDNVVVYAVPV
jgi:LPXTG-site transpeptidase (sortase) family protein